MKKILMILSYLALVALILAPCLFWMGKIDLRGNIIGMNAATVLWFVTAPFWMEKKKS